MGKSSISKPSAPELGGVLQQANDLYAQENYQAVIKLLSERQGLGVPYADGTGKDDDGKAFTPSVTLYRYAYTQNALGPSGRVNWQKMAAALIEQVAKRQAFDLVVRNVAANGKQVTFAQEQIYLQPLEVSVEKKAIIGQVTDSGFSSEPAAAMANFLGWGNEIELIYTVNEQVITRAINETNAGRFSYLGFLFYADKTQPEVKRALLVAWLKHPELFTKEQQQRIPQYWDIQDVLNQRDQDDFLFGRFAISPKHANFIKAKTQKYVQQLWDNDQEHIVALLQDHRLTKDIYDAHFSQAPTKLSAAQRALVLKQSSQVTHFVTAENIEAWLKDVSPQQQREIYLNNAKVEKSFTMSKLKQLLVGSTDNRFNERCYAITELKSFLTVGQKNALFPQEKVADCISKGTEDPYVYQRLNSLGQDMTVAEFKNAFPATSLFYFVNAKLIKYKNQSLAEIIKDHLLSAEAVKSLDSKTEFSWLAIVLQQGRYRMWHYAWQFLKAKVEEYSENDKNKEPSNYEAVFIPIGVLGGLTVFILLCAHVISLGPATLFTTIMLGVAGCGMVPGGFAGMLVARILGPLLEGFVHFPLEPEQAIKQTFHNDITEEHIKSMQGLDELKAALKDPTVAQGSQKKLGSLAREVQGENLDIAPGYEKVLTSKVANISEQTDLSSNQPINAASQA